jgi:hypothetical protein
MSSVWSLLGWSATELRPNHAHIELPQRIEVVPQSSSKVIQWKPAPLGPVDHRVGNVSGLAAWAILVPGASGQMQVQVRIEQGAEVVAGRGQMDRGQMDRLEIQGNRM